jgi:hypothetical protein
MNQLSSIEFNYQVWSEIMLEFGTADFSNYKDNMASAYALRSLYLFFVSIYEGAEYME